MQSTNTVAQTTFSWFNGTTGQVWNANDANTGGRTYTLPSGLVVTVTIIDPNNRNCDPNLGTPHPYDAGGSCTPFPGANGTELTNVYTTPGTIVDPWDSDCDPIYTQTNGNYGLTYLTYGIKTVTSAEEVTLRFTFSRPIYLNNFTITDIDYYGLAYAFNNLSQYESPGNSFQDEVRFLASNVSGNVPLTFSAVGSALTLNAATQTVKATYNTNANGDLLPTDAAATVTVNAGITPITTLDITYSNGPEDATAEQTGGAAYYNWWFSGRGATNGVSDDQGIRVPGFTYTPCPVITFTTNNPTTCSGFPTILTATSPAGGVAPYTYKWLNPSGVQVSTSQLYVIGSVTNANEGNYTAVVTDVNGCYVTQTVTLTANSLTASVISSDQSICSGGDPDAFTATTAATGDGTLTYQWQRSTTGCTSGFSNISGATSATYDPPTGLTQTTYYRVVTTSTLNSIPCTANSNCVTVTVYPKPTITVSTIPTTVCVGANLSLTATTSGGLGACTVQWQSSPNGITWSNISGATSNTYNVASLGITTRYRAQLLSCTGNGCCN